MIIIIKIQIDQILEKLHIQPVGNGYIDCICQIDNVSDFIDAMSKLEVKIIEYSWWCFVTKNHMPCGMGGPKNRFGKGWYSEMEMGKTYPFFSNDYMKRYFSVIWKSETNYKPCFVPAFWLDVPNDWENIYKK